MFVYWLLFLMFAAGSIGTRRLARTSRQGIPFHAAIWLLVIIIGLRFEVGGDWTPYMSMFESAQYQDWADILTQSDPGYMALNRLAGEVGGGIWLVNLVCAAIFCFGLARFANNQPDPWLAVLIAVPYLVVVVAMGYTRQGVAIGFLMAAIPAVERRHYLTFFTLIALAATFHKTAITMIPLIALSSQRHKLVVWPLAAGLTAVIFIFFVNIFLDSMVLGYVEDKNMQSSGAGPRVFMNAVAAVIFLSSRRRLALSQQEDIIWRNFSIAAILMCFGLFSSSSTVVDRIALYFIPLQIFVFSRVYLAFPVKQKPNDPLLILVILYSALVMMVWLNFASNASSWLPYKSYLLQW